MRIALGLLGLLLALVVVAQLARRALQPVMTAPPPAAAPAGLPAGGAAAPSPTPAAPPQTPQQFKQTVEGLMATPRGDEAGR